ncbi:MAG: ABC transporter ATP-binding protein [Deltaproteobacteria bacterium]|nr:ABC transporter ATP-binding protein [Deltaproteobacteria bacterium]
MKYILEVKNLSTAFKLQSGWYRATTDISFALRQNETLAVVGESGCGKSVTAFSLMGLLPEHGSRIDSGSALFKGEDLLTMPREKLRKIRGSAMTMIFQEPMTSLNPVLTVGSQIAEAVYYHMNVGKAAAKKRALELMDMVKIPDPKNRYNDYPHHLSGGMCQRIMIAMSLACEPDLVFADEPTTALDVTIQAQMIYLLNELKEKQQMSMVFITHDLGVVAHVADRVAVMYAGTIVETAPVADLFADPRHPYTRALLKSIPRLDKDNKDITPIQGMVPSIDNMPEGCRFFARCEKKDQCRPDEFPQLLPLKNSSNHQVRCLLCE